MIMITLKGELDKIKKTLFKKGFFSNEGTDGKLFCSLSESNPSIKESTVFCKGFDNQALIINTSGYLKDSYEKMPIL